MSSNLVVESLVPELKKGLCFIVSAPAGTGKTTLVEMLMKEFPAVVMNISFTTREPRAREIPGKDYFFVSKEEFEAKISADEFLEYVELYGNYYGSSRGWVEKKLDEGKHVVLVIDTQGARKLKGKCEAVSIFIRPPSLEVLRKRISDRKTESPEMIEKRLKWADEEMKAITEYDYQIVNDNLLTAYQVLKSIVIAESHRVIN